MAGKCKYCGFVGTQDEIVDHAGEMCQGDCQPDTMVKNFTDNQQTKGEICDDIIETDSPCDYCSNKLTDSCKECCVQHYKNTFIGRKLSPVT